MKKAIVFLGIASALLIACGEEPTTNVNTQDLSAVKERLRNRVEAWYSDTNRSGVNGGQCAISCHTTMPFMIMNPMKSLDDRVTADGYHQIISARVQNWDNLQPLYSWSPAPSRSTEAIINTVSLLKYDLKVTGALSDVACKALENLWPLQQDDGHFQWLDASLSPWEDTYAPYFAASMLSSALGEFSTTLRNNASLTACTAWQNQSPNIAALNQFLQNNYDTANKHGQAWYLWANQSWGYALSNRQEHKEKISKLLDLQRADGGFDLKDFGPFRASAESTAMSQPYITGIMIKALGSPTDDTLRQSLKKAKDYMNAFTPDDINSLQSLNKPQRDWNNGLFQDANLAFFLGEY